MVDEAHIGGSQHWGKREGEREGEGSHGLLAECSLIHLSSVVLSDTEGCEYIYMYLLEMRSAQVLMGLVREFGDRQVEIQRVMLYSVLTIAATFVSCTPDTSRRNKT